jgi:hypothetical protein
MTDENPPYVLILPSWVRHCDTPISSLDIHPSGEIFATGGWDHYIKLWSFRALSTPKDVKHKLIAILYGHTSTINCVRFSPDGVYLASCGLDPNVLLWQRTHSFGAPATFGLPEKALRPNKPIQKWDSRTLYGNTGDVNGISWSPDSQRIASCSIDGMVIIWDVETSSILRKSKNDIGVLAIAWDPLDRYLVIQTLDGKVTVFDQQLTKLKELVECLSNPASCLMNRLCWSADGSFFGVPGYGESFIGSFFQRDSFDLGFSLEGHLAPITCLASASFLLKASQTFCNLVASVDSSGVLAIWILGEEVNPHVILDGVSRSVTNDLAWSPDGKYLLLALDSDPVAHEGGILVIRFTGDFGYSIVEPVELAELKNRLAGDSTFSCQRRPRRPPAAPPQTLDLEEADLEVAIVQFTTEEIIERQIETIIDGNRTIQPVLLTPRQLEKVSFECRPNGVFSQGVPHELKMASLNWGKGAQMSAEPSHLLVLDDRVVVACDGNVFMLDKFSGRRLTVPFVIGAPCMHLLPSESKDAVLAVGAECFIFELPTMRYLRSFPYLTMFYEFRFVKADMLFGFADGRSWMWDLAIEAWVGGSIANTPGDSSVADVERLSEWKPNESAEAYWFDTGMTMLYSLHINAPLLAQEKLQSLSDNNESPKTKDFVACLEKTLLDKWHWENGSFIDGDY